jgi:multiple sugar transport system substrate-binding protein
MPSSTDASVSRRAFLRQCSLIAIGGLLTACSPAPSTAPAPSGAASGQNAAKPTAAPAEKPAAPAAQPTVAAAAQPTAAPAVTGGAIELNVAFPDWQQPGNRESLLVIKESFEAENPNVKVKEIAFPFGQFHDQMLTQMNAGSPPDVLRNDTPQQPSYMERGLLAPLDQAFKEAGIDPNSLVSIQKEAQYDGQHFGAAYAANPRALVYNKALYEETGLKAPTNLEEFKTAVTKLTRADRQQFGLSLASKAGDATGLFIQIMPIVIGMGGHFFKDGKLTATDPNVISALTLVKELWDNNSVPRGLDAVGANTLIYEGKAASTLSGPFIIGQTKSANPDTASKLEVVPSPLPSGTTLVVSAFWAVPAKAKNRELGAKFVMHMLRPEGQRAIIDKQATVPGRPEMVSEEYLRANPWFKVFIDAGKDGISQVPAGTGARAFDAVKVIGRGIEDILYRDKPVATAMAEVQRELEGSFGG